MGPISIQDALRLPWSQEALEVQQGSGCCRRLAVPLRPLVRTANPLHAVDLIGTKSTGMVLGSLPMEVGPPHQQLRPESESYSETREEVVGGETLPGGRCVFLVKCLFQEPSRAGKQLGLRFEEACHFIRAGTNISLYWHTCTPSSVHGRQGGFPCSCN